LPSNAAADACCDRGCRPPAAQGLFRAWAAGRKERLPPRQRKVSVVMSVYQEPVTHRSRPDLGRLPWNANDFRALAYSLAGRGTRGRRPSSHEGKWCSACGARSLSSAAAGAWAGLARCTQQERCYACQHQRTLQPSACGCCHTHAQATTHQAAELDVWEDEGGTTSGRPPELRRQHAERHFD
jgi:hypothetical protein